MTQNTKSERRWLWFVLRLSFTIGVLGALVLWLSPSELMEAMSRTGILLWILVVLAALTAHVFVAAKWRLLLDAAGTPNDFRSALRAHGAGLFSNTFLPSAFGGDVIRAGLIARIGKNVPATVTGSIADRLVDVTALVILAALGMMAMPQSQSALGLGILGITGIGLLISAFCAIVLLPRVNPEQLPARLAQMISESTRALQAMRARSGTALAALFASLIIQAFFVLQNVLIGTAVGIEVPATVWFVVWPVAKLAALAPISVGGLGVREGALAALLLPFGVPPTLSVAASLIWQTVVYAVGVAGGVTSFWIGRPPEKRPSRVGEHDTHAA